MSVPKKVDHAQRRREISAAVVRLAARRGLQGVSFREVAAEAGVSVSLVQHYFGTKENLLLGTLDIQSAAMGEHVGRRLAGLGPDPDHSMSSARLRPRSSPPTTRAVPRCSSTTRSRRRR